MATTRYGLTGPMTAYGIFLPKSVVVVVPGPITGVQPNMISGLVLWVRSNTGRFTTAAGSVAAASAGDPVGRWEDVSVSQTDLTQATAGSRPTYQTDTSPSVRFDGTDDYLSYVGNRENDTIGSLIVAFETGATAFATLGDQVLFASAAADENDNWFEVGITDGGKIYIEWNDFGDLNTVEGVTTLSVSTKYYITMSFDGTDYTLYLSDTLETPLSVINAGPFGWLGDVLATNITIGGTVTNAGLVRPFEGDIHEVALYNTDIIEDSLPLASAVGKYLETKYGISGTGVDYHFPVVVNGEVSLHRLHTAHVNVRG